MSSKYILKHSGINVGIMGFSELRSHIDKFEKKKLRYKQEDVRRRQEVNLQNDMEIRKRINDSILTKLLEKTKVHSNPTIQKLYFELKANANNTFL